MRANYKHKYGITSVFLRLYSAIFTSLIRQTNEFVNQTLRAIILDDRYKFTIFYNYFVFILVLANFLTAIPIVHYKKCAKREFSQYFSGNNLINNLIYASINTDILD